MNRKQKEFDLKTDNTQNEIYLFHWFPSTSSSIQILQTTQNSTHLHEEILVLPAHCNLYLYYVPNISPESTNLTHPTM